MYACGNPCHGTRRCLSSRGGSTIVIACTSTGKYIRPQRVSQEGSAELQRLFQSIHMDDQIILDQHQPPVDLHCHEIKLEKHTIKTKRSKGMITPTI